MSWHYRENWKWKNNSIFRIIEGFEGKILIDEMDINKLNLDFLRQNKILLHKSLFY